MRAQNRMKGSAKEMQVSRFVLIAGLCALCLTQISSSRKAPTVYDIFALVYRLCATAAGDRPAGLECVDYYIGADVSEVVEKCLSQHKFKKEEPKINETADMAATDSKGVQLLCDKMTLVQEWTTKHSRPPNQLTTVIGIEALGRMTCVMSSIQRPLPTWTAAFSKCFPKEDSFLDEDKHSLKGSPSRANL